MQPTVGFDQRDAIAQSLRETFAQEPQDSDGVVAPPLGSRVRVVQPLKAYTADGARIPVGLYDIKYPIDSVGACASERWLDMDPVGGGQQVSVCIGKVGQVHLDWRGVLNETPPAPAQHDPEAA